MPATVTLNTTTLAAFAAIGDTQVCLASTSGLVPGTRLWVDRELMAVVSLGPTSSAGPLVNVRRGVDGTATTDHASNAVVTIGRSDQFYSSDPDGRPPEAIPVSPYINVNNGNVWFARGDASATSNRWWQLQTVTYGAGAFGVVSVALDPTSST